MRMERGQMIRRDIALLGTAGIRMVDTGQALHRVPDSVIMAGLTTQLDSLFPAGWYVCLLFADGRGTMRGDGRSGTVPDREQSERLLELCTLVNREQHEGGHWVGAWSDGHLSILWRDTDGDAQFTVDFHETWVRVRAWTAHYMAGRAQAGFDAWTDRMRAVERKETETFKKAQGQRSRGRSLLIH